LLSAVFPQLANVRGMPEGDDVYEWTRFFVIPARREGDRARRAGFGRICRSVVEPADSPQGIA
jgi:acyl-homoserine lactone synthase